MNITELALDLHKFIQKLDISEKNKNKIHAKIIDTITKLLLLQIMEENNE